MKKRTSLTILTLLVCGLVATASGGNIIINPFVFKDTTPPTLVSATVDTSGDVLTLVFSEAVHVASGTWNNDWTISGTANTTGLVYVSGDGTSTITYNVSGHGGVQGDDKPIINYSQATTIIQDPAGNALAPIVDYPITNNAE